MKQIKVNITNIDPLLLAQSSGERNTVSTYDYIPGSSLLGIFASKFIETRGLKDSAHESEIFKKWFLSDNLIFCNSYITYKDDLGKYNVAFPTPTSIRKIKYKKDIVDLLCNNVDEKTEKFSTYSKIDKKTLYNVRVQKNVNFHHERDKTTGASKKGIIYNYENIQASQNFKGRIIGKSSEIDNFFNEFRLNNDFRLGRSKNSQYSKINLTLSEPEELEIIRSIKKDDKFVNVYLISDLIIYNENGFPTVNLEYFEKYLKKLICNKISIENAYIDTNFLENYVSKWKLKKPMEVTFLAGSGFKLNIEKLSDLERVKLIQILSSGIGQRINEGFGRTILNFDTPQHIIDSNKIDKQTNANFDNTEIPIISQEIIKYSIKNIIISETKKIAINDVNDVHNISIKNSLIGRLILFIKFSTLQDELKSQVEKLRKPARKQLEDQIINGKTFKDILTNFDVPKYVYSSLKISQLQNEFIIIKNDLNFNATLYKIYYLTLLNFLRKKNKSSC